GARDGEDLMAFQTQKIQTGAGWLPVRLQDHYVRGAAVEKVDSQLFCVSVSWNGGKQDRPPFDGRAEAGWGGDRPAVPDLSFAIGDTLDAGPFLFLPADGHPGGRRDILAGDRHLASGHGHSPGAGRKLAGPFQDIGRLSTAVFEDRRS